MFQKFHNRMKISQLELGTEIFSSHLGPNLNLGYSLFKILEDGNSINFCPKISKKEYLLKIFGMVRKGQFSYMQYMKLQSEIVDDFLVPILSNFAQTALTGIPPSPKLTLSSKITFSSMTVVVTSGSLVFGVASIGSVTSCVTFSSTSLLVTSSVFASVTSGSTFASTSVASVASGSTLASTSVSTSLASVTSGSGFASISVVTSSAFTSVISGSITASASAFAAASASAFAAASASNFAAAASASNFTASSASALAFASA